MSAPALTSPEIEQVRSRAEQLDAADPLARFVSRFLPYADESVRAYLDGNFSGPPAGGDRRRPR